MNFRAQLSFARQQLEAIRMQAEVLAGQLDNLLAQAPAACPHPEEQRSDAATLTHPTRFWCRACQSFIEEPALAEERASLGGLRP
ncbi:MAG: hypothetical protein EHM88_17105 [Candidatus Rokuibacteriota bacterium]|nr:MAG: hypothetical protein EHM88_17105 [Candidatus Rokubacteria bacterium]